MHKRCYTSFKKSAKRSALFWNCQGRFINRLVPNSVLNYCTVQQKMNEKGSFLFIYKGFLLSLEKTMDTAVYLFKISTIRI